MEPESAAHAVFTTPELAFALFSSLTPHDLTQCTRVCRQWTNHAEPVLWKDFCFGKLRRTRLPPKTTSGLIRNLPHIRTVELTLHDHTILQELAYGVPQSLQPNEPGVDPSTPCTHLRRLTLENSSAFDERIDLMLPKIVTLLLNNLYLTRLTIPFLEVEIGDPVIAAISNLKNLQSFAVYSSSSSSSVGTQTISLLLQACLPLPKLAELCIDLKVSWRKRNKGIVGLEDYEFGFSNDEDLDISDDEAADVSNDEDSGVPSLEAIVKKAAIARFSQIPTPGKIKSLQLPAAPERSKTPLAVPLLKSGLLDLESCTIFSFTKDSQPDDIERIVREYCPNLKRLRCPGHGYLDDCRHVRAFIRGCSGLQSFAADGYCERIYTYDNNPPESRHVITTLVSHHCDTLEDFELDRCTGMFMSDLREVLYRCKQLKRYRVTGFYLEARGTYRNGHARSNLMDLSEGDWACTELRELRITLDRTVQHLAKRFYAQIGRLGKLEQLTFDATKDPFSIKRQWDCSYDLTLSRGYLGEMLGLKSLRSLRVDMAFWRNMGQDELEFIQAHCPLLRTVNVMGRAG
ncbi:hypothetical protein BGZ68_007998 [Mortierella alpina]|nr:hypothetical protein BGZ68_007998 [Mortierella alpina]